jgi:hypothetical protein
LKFCQPRFWIRYVEQNNFPVTQEFPGSAGAVAVVAFTGKNQDCIARASEFAGAGGDFLADTTNDRRFSLAGRPGGTFPFAHLRDADDRNWHGLSVAKFEPSQKENVGGADSAPNGLRPPANGSETGATLGYRATHIPTAMRLRPFRFRLAPLTVEPQLVGVISIFEREPKVPRASQPWAEGRNPVGGCYELSCKMLNNNC